MRLLLLLVLSCSLGAQVVKTSLVYSVNVPGTSSKGSPVVILLHGYGSNESDLFALSNTIGSNIVTFSLRGPFSTSNGGFCWSSLEFLPDHQFKVDQSQVDQSVKLILEFIRNACRAYQLDSTRVFLVGFSQGAMMSYEIASKAPAKIAGAVILSGRMLPATAASHPAKSISKIRFFVGHGTSDNVIPFDQAKQAEKVLKESWKIADLTFKEYPAPHTITGAELNAFREWLGKRSGR